MQRLEINFGSKLVSTESPYLEFQGTKHVAHNKKFTNIKCENTKFNKLNEVVGR